MKGIILAGGTGSRLYPITIPTLKQLLPIYDKPMIYYPLSVLMEVGVRDILIISTPCDVDRYKKLFGEGSQLGLNFSYIAQEKPRGLADAFILGEDFVGDDSVFMILGDNLFNGPNFRELLKRVSEEKEGAVIFASYVDDPERYGVVEFDTEGNVVSIEEKPEMPKSNYAQNGLYYYAQNPAQLAKSLKPSKRGEIEITDLNNIFLKEGKLKVKVLEKGFVWMDTGTIDSLYDASEYVRIMEKRQGIKIGCIEEIAYKKGYIDVEQLKKLAEPLKKSNYGKYLFNLLEE